MNGSIVAPEADILPLRRADGSARYSYAGYSVLAAVNGPVDVQRRDELPEEAAIDVIVRPAAGVGGVRERHFESILEKTLRHIILVSAHPRTQIQITLQVTHTPENESSSGRLFQAASNLPVLPALLQASVLALLSASLPLTMMLTSTTVAIGIDNSLIHDPTLKQLQTATSVHVFAFSSRGDLVLVESEGKFSFHAWEEAANEAMHRCRGNENKEDNVGDINMDTEDHTNLENFLKSIVEQKVRKDQAWKESIKREQRA